MITAMAIGFTWASAGSTGLALALTVLFLAACWPIGYPTRYRIDGTGVLIDYGLYKRQVPWGGLRDARRERGGIVLSTVPAGLWIDRFRGLYLPVPKALRDEALAAAQGWIALQKGADQPSQEPAEASGK